MSTVRLSSKGQIVIPKTIRDRHHWHEGQVLEIIETDNGLVLQGEKSSRKPCLKIWRAV